MATTEIAPPEGFVEDYASPPEGFIEDAPAPPEGFVVDSSPSSTDTTKAEASPSTQAVSHEEQGKINLANYQMTKEQAAAKYPDLDEAGLMAKRAEFQKAYNENRAPLPSESPLVPIPKPQGKGVIPSAARGLLNVAEGLETPMNLMLMGGTLALPEVPATIVGAAFLGDMASHVPAQVKKIINSETPGEAAEAGAELLGTGALLGVGGKHLLARPGKGGIAETNRSATSPEDIARLEASVPSVENLAPEATIPEVPTTGEPLKIVAQVITNGEAPTPEMEAQRMFYNDGPRVEQKIIGKETQPLTPPEPTIGTSNVGASLEKNVNDMLMMASGDHAKAAAMAEQYKMPEVAAELRSRGAPAIEEHLLPSKDVADILAEQPAEPKMKAPEAGTEEGAIFPSKKPAVRPIGDTPRGDTNWLRVPSALARTGRGLFTEGARHVLERTNNQVGQALAKATRRHVDLEQELYGQHEAILRRTQDVIPKERLEPAYTEAEQYFREIENKRPAPALSPEAQSLVDAWYDIGEKTGNIARANNVQVNDPATGGHRPMGHVKDYVPRMFRPEVERVMADPKSDPALFNRLANELAAKRGVTAEEAAKELRGVAGRFSSNDFMGNMELARTEQMPEGFYEYDLRSLASRYLPSFSERMSQIISYGQRLGPREAPTRMNLWDIARRESEDASTQKWLSTAEDQATGFKPKDETDKNFARAQTLTTAALLSNPTSTVVRNLLSGLSATTETFGVRRAMAEVKGAAKAASRLDAKAIGAVREDMADFLHADQLGKNPVDELIGKVTNKALKYSGFSGSETFVRTHNALTASSFAQDAVASLTKNPKNALSKEALALMKRWDVNPETVIAEGANWRSGPETRKFIRTAVREMQGGYKFDQVPLWANSPRGRFFYQYGRWGVQRAQNIFKNVAQQAIGEKVEFRGQQMTHRNVMPLVRMGLLAVGLGETFGGIASALFGRDRRDASFKEIHEAWDDDKKQAVGLAFERAINDVIMAGTLGLLGQPVDFLKSVKDQSRLKNPAEPPSAVGPKALVDLARKALDQRGTLTNNDLLEFAGQVMPGLKGLYDIGRHVTGGKVYEAQNDQRTLRNAARRWAQKEGKDIGASGGMGRKNQNSPIYEKINTALLSGDADSAKKLAHEFYGATKNPLKARTSLGQSVTSRQPFRAGNLHSPGAKHQFMQWAEKNLSKEDLEQVKRVQQTYLLTAYKAGILDPP